MRRARALLALRVVCGGVFVVFGVGKFVNHAAELASFKSYGLPVPGVFVIAVGVIEIVGGALLIFGRCLRPTVLVLAGDMIGAIVVSGVERGDRQQPGVGGGDVCELLERGLGAVVVDHDAVEQVR